MLPDLVTLHSRSSTVVLIALRVEGRDLLCVSSEWDLVNVYNVIHNKPNMQCKGVDNG